MHEASQGPLQDAMLGQKALQRSEFEVRSCWEERRKKCFPAASFGQFFITNMMAYLLPFVKQFFNCMAVAAVFESRTMNLNQGCGQDHATS